MKDLPQWLNKKAWTEWVQFRKELRKPLKPTTINRQLKFLEKHEENHAQILEQSIQNGWQGLFEGRGELSFKRQDAEVGSIAWRIEQEALFNKEIIDVTVENM